jgi:hypothetical protein
MSYRTSPFNLLATVNLLQVVIANIQVEKPEFEFESDWKARARTLQVGPWVNNMDRAYKLV